MVWEWKKKNHLKNITYSGGNNDLIFADFVGLPNPGGPVGESN